MSRKDGLDGEAEAGAVLTSRHGDAAATYVIATSESVQTNMQSCEGRASTLANDTLTTTATANGRQREYTRLGDEGPNMGCVCHWQTQRETVILSHHDAPPPPPHSITLLQPVSCCDTDDAIWANVPSEFASAEA